MSGGCYDGEGLLQRDLPTATGGTAGGSTDGGAGGGSGGVSETGLRRAAKLSQRLIGAAVNAQALADDVSYAEVLSREFDYVTPENATKWGSLQPTSSSYSWGEADRIVDFAQAHSQAIKGHAFVWHRQLPAWVNDSMRADELRGALRSHIETTLERYRGRVRAWDVVNEAITESGFTDSVFFRTLGPGYIEEAFLWAREADPDVLLYYNDFAIERIGPKSNRVYAVMQDLLSRGVPIDGIGFQSHCRTTSYPSEADLRANIRRFAALGLKVNISELDVGTVDLPGDRSTQWQAERVVFQQVVGVCATEPGCDAVTLWGFTDKYSWINTQTKPDAPLVFDQAYAPKPAYEGVLAGLSGVLPTRGENLVNEGDFAEGGALWAAVGGEISIASGPDGLAGCVSGRTDVSHGMRQSLLDQLQAGGQFSFSTRVRIAGASSAMVRAVLTVQLDGADPSDVTLAAVEANDADWVELTGDRGLGFGATPLVIDLKLDGPPAGVDLCVAGVEMRQITAP